MGTSGATAGMLWPAIRRTARAELREAHQDMEPHQEAPAPILEIRGLMVLPAAELILGTRLAAVQEAIIQEGLVTTGQVEPREVGEALIGFLVNPRDEAVQDPTGHRVVIAVQVHAARAAPVVVSGVQVEAVLQEASVAVAEEVGPWADDPAEAAQVVVDPVADAGIKIIPLL